MAKKARDMGAELFVLDDGWFGDRNSDTVGLGDYRINKKKLPSGLKTFRDKVKGMGMMFGLWFEPEMVNEDSDLYRAHPEYAVTAPGRVAVRGRNQLVLDLCNPAVQDYIIENVGRVLDENGIDYVKWDMNRHIAESYSPWLAEQGICLRAGLHCAPDAHTALGTIETGGTIRISPGYFNTEEDIEKCIEAVSQLAEG